MKKIILLLVIVSIFVLSSCAQTQNPDIPVTKPEIPAEEKTDLQNLQDVLDNEEAREEATSQNYNETPGDEGDSEVIILDKKPTGEVSEESQKLIEEASAELETIFLQEDLFSEIFAGEK